MDPDVLNCRHTRTVRGLIQVKYLYQALSVTIYRVYARNCNSLEGLSERHDIVYQVLFQGSQHNVNISNIEILKFNFLLKM